MTTAQLVIGIILIVFAVFLVIAVLLQQGKAHNLSGTIAGGAETFFGKSKAQTINKKLSILTTVVAIIFVVLVCSVYVMQDTGKASDFNSFWGMVFGEMRTRISTIMTMRKIPLQQRILLLLMIPLRLTIPQRLMILPLMRQLRLMLWNK